MSPEAELRGKSNSQLAFALGMAINAAPARLPPGTLVALANELRARGLLDDITSILDTENRKLLALKIGVDKSRLRRTSAR